MIAKFCCTKQRLSILYGQLCDHSNSSKTRRVVSRHIIVVPEHLLQASPLLEALVYCFLPWANSLFHSRSICAYKGIWGHDKAWTLTNVTAIGFGSLSFSQKILQRMSKDRDIWPFSTRKRPMHPHNVTTENAQADLIAKARPLELVGIPSCPERRQLGDHEICPIDRYQNIIPNIAP
jgi:hypothetical protein